MLPLPPPVISISTNQTIKIVRKAKPGDPILEVRLKSVTNTGLATVTFSQDMRIPPNISAIDNKVLALQVLNGPASDPEKLKILRWKVKCKEFLILNV